MSVLSTLATAGPWHALTFGTLFGSQFYQTFVGGIISHRALPPPMFSKLQQKIFPTYFTLQSILPVVLLATHPSTSVVSLLSTSSPYFYNTTVPAFVTIFSSLVNLFVVAPATVRVMRERKVQGAKDGKNYYEEGPKSDAMEKLNAKFRRIHGISSLLALLGLGATAAYGVVLGSNFNL